jgi:hypothetical protein
VALPVQWAARLGRAGSSWAGATLQNLGANECLSPTDNT